MNSLRQLGSGLLYALVSVVLVVGGLSLALAEGGIKPVPAPASPQPSLTAPPPSFTAPAPSATAGQASATSALVAAPSSTPVIIIAVTATRPPATATTYVLPRATATRRVYPTAVPCGPYSGWLLSYTVQAGDTLYHIATLYRTNVAALQKANCLTSTFIYPGERLWVPNVPTITPGITLPPSYATATAYPTLPLTLTPLPFTETVEPSDTTSNPDP